MWRLSRRLRNSVRPAERGPGLQKRHYELLNNGHDDADYRGEVKVILVNLSDTDFWLLW